MRILPMKVSMSLMKFFSWLHQLISLLGICHLILKAWGVMLANSQRECLDFMPLIFHFQVQLHKSENFDIRTRKHVLHITSLNHMNQGSLNHIFNRHHSTCLPIATKKSYLFYAHGFAKKQCETIAIINHMSNLRHIHWSQALLETHKAYGFQY